MYIEVITTPEFVLWDEKRLTFIMGFGGSVLSNDDVGNYAVGFELTDSQGAISDPYTIVL